MNLHRIAWTDGVDNIDLHNSSLHHVQAAVIFQYRILVFRDSQNIPCNLHPVLTLILDIVDGKHGANIVEFWDTAVECVQIHRNQRGVPIVCVHDVRVEVDVVEHLHRSLGEEGKALGIVIVAIQIVPFKIILIIQKVIGHALVYCLEYAAVLVAPRQRHIKIADKLHLFPQSPWDIFVHRDDHSALVAGVAQRLGE